MHASDFSTFPYSMASTSPEDFDAISGFLFTNYASDRAWWGVSYGGGPSTFSRGKSLNITPFNIMLLVEFMVDLAASISSLV